MAELGQKVGSHANLRYVLFEGKPQEKPKIELGFKRRLPKARGNLKFTHRTDEQIRD